MDIERPFGLNGDAADYLNEACAIGVEIHALNERAVSKARRRRLLWLKANRAGVKYKQIAAACGYSDAFITKEIRAAREESGSSKMSQRIRRNGHYGKTPAVKA